MAERPSTYNTEIADEICARLTDGESLRSICRDEHMPSKSTVFKWLREVDGFSDQYARAKEESADSHADDIVDIADRDDEDYIEVEDKDGNVKIVANKEHIMRSRLRVDTRKWIASKLKPKKYGDVTRHEHMGEGGGPIEITDGQLVSKLSAILEAARRRAIDGEYTDITDQQLIEHAPDDGSDLL